MSIQQPIEDFIGREKEIGVFTQWVNGADEPPVLYVHSAFEEEDKRGGIGKTWLLRKFVELTREQHKHIVLDPDIVDFFNVVDRDGVVVAERLVRALQETYVDWSPASFITTLSRYHEAVSDRSTDIADIRKQLGEALTADLGELQDRMSKNNTYIILFFDTYELIEHNPITAVLSPSQKFPDTYQFDRIRAVVAGRNAADWSHQNWVGRENEVRTIPLSSFDYSETEEYMRAKFNRFDITRPSPQLLDALHKRTEGRPILLGLITDILNRQGKSLEFLVAMDQTLFEESLAKEINDFGDRIKWLTLFMAHIYHRFGEEILSLIRSTPELRQLVPEIQYQELLDTLSTLSFVRRSSSSSDFVLHDEMRRLMKSYSWPAEDPDKRVRRQLSKVVIEYYDRRMAQEINEELRESYIVEKLFHMLFIDVNAGVNFFDEHFTRALDLSLRAFARSLLQEVQKFDEESLLSKERKDNVLSTEQRQSIKLAEARLLRTEENPQAALQLYEELEYDTAWAEDHRAEILFGKASSYELMSDLSKAITYYNECLEIEKAHENKPRYATILNHLGYIARRQGYYSRAREYYEESLKISRTLDNPQEYASVLNNIGNVYRVQGDLETALLFCKRSLQIRTKLYEEGKISQFYVGLTHSTLGHIYHTLKMVTDEEYHYQKAFDIYTLLGYKKEIASACNCLGRVWVEKNDPDKALRYFKEASQVSRGIDRAAEIESLNQQGRIFRAQKKWEESIEYFEQAVALAYQIKQRFNEAENLLYLAGSLDQLGRPSSQQIEQAKQIALELDHKFLLGRIEEILGDMYYRRHEYQTAFEHYREACRFMALYSKVEFEAILRRLYDLLFDIPSDLLPGITDSLLKYWSDHQLDEAFPQFPRTCKTVQDL